MKHTMPQAGANLRDSLRYCLDCGCTITTLRRTGELSISHPSIGPRQRVDLRRKDTPRRLSAFIRKLPRPGVPA